MTERNCSTCRLLTLPRSLENQSHYRVCSWKIPEDLNLPSWFRKRAGHYTTEPYNWQTRGHVDGTAPVCTKHGLAKAGTNCSVWEPKEP